MKNLGLSRFASALALYALLFSSCSKDSLTKPQQVSNKAKKQWITTDNPTATGGIVTANIQPTYIMTSLLVYNDHWTSTETNADQDGNVSIDGIPEGTYTVVAYAYFPYDATSDREHTTYTIQKLNFVDVEVFDGQITDMGTISFE